jgi:predicted dehydrogenase
MKELIDDGHLGEPRVIRWGWLLPMLAEPNSRAWSWWSEREKGGGIFGALGSHLIDSLLWWFGPIEEVTAQLGTFYSHRPLPDGKGSGAVTADEDVALMLRFASGARCTVDLTGYARPSRLLLEAYGSEGALAIEEDERLLVAQGKGGWEPAEIPSRLVRQVAGDPRLGPFVELADRLVTRVRGGETPDFADFHQGLRVQTVMDAAHLSADERRTVRVETPAV